MRDASAGLGTDLRWRVIVGDSLPIFADGLRTLAARTEDISVVATATTTDALLEAITLHGAHVVIVDASLPPGGGLSVLRTLKENESRLPVLMLASEEAHGAPRALSEGATGLLSKSCSPAALFSAVRSIAAGDVVLDPAAAAALVHRNGYASLQLSDTEVELLDLFMAGATQSEIAKKLLMSESTLKRKFNEVQRKLGARTRVEAVARAARIGLV